MVKFRLSSDQVRVEVQVEFGSDGKIEAGGLCQSTTESNFLKL